MLSELASDFSFTLWISISPLFMRSKHAVSLHLNSHNSFTPSLLVLQTFQVDFHFQIAAKGGRKSFLSHGKYKIFYRRVFSHEIIRFCFTRVLIFIFYASICTNLCSTYSISSFLLLVFVHRENLLARRVYVWLFFLPLFCCSFSYRMIKLFELVNFFMLTHCVVN